MSFWDTIKESLSKKTSFMAFIGWTLILSMIMIDFYELIQLNYFFGKTKVNLETYERLVSMIMLQIKEHSMIALLYYFGQKYVNNDKL